jgi:hypothetical protein
MKKQNSYSSLSSGFTRVCLLIVLCCSLGNLIAQDSTAPVSVAKKSSFVKKTFEGNFILDNQTVMVPIKGTFEFDIQHRFGTTDKGISKYTPWV